MGNCICCDQIQPYHSPQESTIVYDTGICGAGPRRAPGSPQVLSRGDYDQVFQRAGSYGLAIRICFEANFFGHPCCGHGVDIAGIEAKLNQDFPHLHIRVTDHYQGCDDNGHWEFVVTIQPQPRNYGVPVKAVPVKAMEREKDTGEFEC